MSVVKAFVALAVWLSLLASASAVAGAASRGGGNDVLAGGRGTDTITCGAGTDTAYAGPGDTVAGDCERRVPPGP
jgi:Ca2+-binding RTX toxin-like protein